MLLEASLQGLDFVGKFLDGHGHLTQSDKGFDHGNAHRDGLRAVEYIGCH